MAARLAASCETVSSSCEGVLISTVTSYTLTH